MNGEMFEVGELQPDTFDSGPRPFREVPCAKKQLLGLRKVEETSLYY
jgi:hypothetical protein